MKVQITLELDEDQRIAVGFIQHGQFRPAMREDVREFALGVLDPIIHNTVAIVEQAKEQIAYDVRKEIMSKADDE